jgi:hypothetical protein
MHLTTHRPAPMKSPTAPDYEGEGDPNARPLPDSLMLILIGIVYGCLMCGVVAFLVSKHG